MHEAALQALALLSSLCGMGWLALSLDTHWEQVRGTACPRERRVTRLRVLAGASVAASLAACLAADQASIAVLVWIMSLALAQLLVAFALAARPRWLRWLAVAGD